jgi:hypothetical protein
MPATPVKIAKPAAKPVAAAPVQETVQPVQAPVAAPAPAAPAPETHVNIELVHGHSYGTMKKTYVKGEVYRVPLAVWEMLRKDRESMTSRPYFAISKRKPTDTTAADHEGAPKDGKPSGITIHHAEPQPMTDDELRRAGLSSWAGSVNNVSTEIDTGAEMVGKDDLAADDEGEGDGFDGLEDGDDLEAAGLAPAAQRPDTPQARAGARNAAAKASLGLPSKVTPKPTEAAPLGDDEVQV